MKRITLYLALGAVLCSVLSSCAVVPVQPVYVGGGGYWHHNHYYYYGR